MEKERRQNRRIYVSLPMKFQVRSGLSGKPRASQAVLKNISPGGLYFECETLPLVKRGNIADFTFITIPAEYAFIKSPIRVQAEVIRIESNVAGSANFGVALKFISDQPFA